VIDVLQNNFALLIPILALMIPIVAIVAHYVSKTRSEQSRHELARELARAGQPIPPQLLAPGKEDVDSDFDLRPRSTNSGLRSAVVNLSVGLGLMGMFWVMQPNRWLWAVGLIPFCLGVGLLLLWVFERRQVQAKP
jgi:Domain of unknown function (DUF6249)